MKSTGTTEGHMEYMRRIPFGMIAIQKGFISEGQVRRALEIQLEEDETKNEHRLIGRILLDQGWITDAEIYQVMGTIHQTGIRTPRLLDANPS